jgi:hypothetical protein
VEALEMELHKSREEGKSADALVCHSCIESMVMYLNTGGLYYCRFPQHKGEVEYHQVPSN